jgi:hypothetical protein
MTNHDLEAVSQAYLDAADGSPLDALRVAVTDLLDMQTEAAFRTAALNRWVSRGFVQGTASEVLTGERRDLWRRRLSEQGWG